MSRDVIFINFIVVIDINICTLHYSISLCDAKFSFLNLLRHRRRSLSTIFAIILGGSAIFLYGGFINYSFWLLKNKQFVPILAMYKFIAALILIPLIKTKVLLRIIHPLNNVS
jgi:hypothetical protein